MALTRNSNLNVIKIRCSLRYSRKTDASDEDGGAAIEVVVNHAHPKLRCRQGHVIRVDLDAVTCSGKGMD